MRLTGISNHGLAVIAVLVAILWGCIVVERTIRREARDETLWMLRSNGALRTIQTPAPPVKPKPKNRLAVHGDLKV
jgi:hypothetical protein